MNFEAVVTVDNMRRSDARTIAESETSAALMYRAATGIFKAVQFTGNIAIVCGAGNNGGDGYALACILCDHGMSPTLFRVTDKFSKDGLFYYRTALSKGCEEGSLRVPNPFTGYDIVVDCILGTGFSGEVRGDVRRVIEQINGCGAYIISADINSGLNGDTGVAGIAVNSDLTVSIGAYKTGMFLADAPYYIDKLRNADIGIRLIDEPYKLISYDHLHMFEGYGSTVWTMEEFYEKTGYAPGKCDVAKIVGELSAEERHPVVVKTAHSAVIGDMQYVYFCADYIG